MEWLKKSIPQAAEPDDIALRQFLFYFIGSFLFGNNWSMLTCKLLGAMRVVSNIGAYYWGALSYEFFIAFLKQALRCGFRSLQGCWQVLTYWAQGYIPALHPQYIGLSSKIYPRAYAWSFYYITRRKVTQVMSESWAQCWFWALSSQMFFLAERTYHQVMPIIRLC